MSKYNPDIPGNLFVGYKKLRQEILMGLQNGNSYAIIGGRRCGKTSVLIQLEQDIKNENKDKYFDISPFNPIPLRFSVNKLENVSPDRLFQTMYELFTQNTQADKWKPLTNREYSNFLNHLESAKPILDEKYGTDWLGIFLIDELDSAISSLQNDRFFQNLRHFLMESGFSRHFRVVATGVKDLGFLISSGASPLNNLRNKYLRILSKKSATELVRKGFSEDYDTDFLFKLTGRHSYLLQAILQKLSLSESKWNETLINQTAHEFLKERNDFPRWIKTFGPSELAVYRCLAKSPDDSMSINDIKKQTNISDVDPSLIILSYHGVIDDEDPDKPKIAGTLFKDWFLTKNGKVYEKKENKIEEQHKKNSSNESKSKYVWLLYICIAVYFIIILVINGIKG